MAARRAISVTLDADNVIWLKGRVGAGRMRSVSAVVDQLVTDARQQGRIGPSRTVAGTIDIDPNDPTLEGADLVVRELFEASLARPLIARERPPVYGASRGKRKRRG